jgi:hypothetical protein
VDALSDAFRNSQRDVAPPRLRSLVVDGDDSRLPDKEAPDRAFAKKPKLRELGYGVVPLKMPGDLLYSAGVLGWSKCSWLLLGVS